MQTNLKPSDAIWKAIVILLFMFMFSGCGARRAASDQGKNVNEAAPNSSEQVQAKDTPTPAAGQLPQIQLREGPDLFGMSDLKDVDQPGEPLPDLNLRYFSTSGNCARCHTDMQDQAGNDVSADRLWRGSMMANASKDPYWQASVKSQLVNVPELNGVIEDKCATCHMPMARFALAQEGQQGLIFGEGLNHDGHPQHEFAMEGVSCTLCHQVEDQRLGQESSFSGEFVIDPGRPTGARWAYGPYPENDRYELIMGGPSGFLPRDSEHVNQSELCAVCHTLYTPYVDQDGEIGGFFPEQVPYLEWKHSGVGHEKECQDCHMPTAAGGVVLSNTGGGPRSPFYQHLFVGGNTYMLRVLRKYGEEMGVSASSADLESKIEDTLQQLQQNAARLSIADVSQHGSQMQIRLSIENKSGHKFPTAFPSRRAWIHLTVKDGTGETIYESGAYNERGMILDGKHDQDPDAYDAHYDTIRSEDQVQIYETVLEDIYGEITTVLLHASGYIKDNRIPPHGFDKETAGEDIRVIGNAMDDDNFLGGRDTVNYSVDIDGQEGPFSIEAELLYQSIGFRWAVNLQRDDSAESERFLRYYEGTPNWPVLIDGDQAEMTPEG